MAHSHLLSIFLEDNAIYATIRDQIRGLDIGVLVNNVGMSYEYPEFFDKVEDSAKLVNNMIRCNVDSVAYMTQMILPGLTATNSMTLNLRECVPFEIKTC